MTDHYHALTVVLARDTRDDDAQALIDAIRQLRNVASVEPHVADWALHTAVVRVRNEYLRRLRRVFEDEL
jgi:hypothetical protein